MRRWVTRSGVEMDDRTSDVSPWDVSQWTVAATILRAQNRRRMKTLMIMSFERLNERKHEIRRTETTERRAHRRKHNDPKEPFTTGITRMFEYLAHATDLDTRCTAPALITATTTEPVSRPSSSLAPLVITARRGNPQSTVTVTNRPCGSISVTRPDR